MTCPGRFRRLSSTFAHSAKPVMSLKSVKFTASLSAAGLPDFMSASAFSTARATRKISVVG